MKKTILFASAFLVLTSAILIACSKDEAESKVQIRLTDAPAAYDEVNIDLQGVRAKFRDDSTGWVTLQARPGIYNLLALQNNVDTLIASGNIPSNVLKELRFFLGTNNTIKVNGRVYPLELTSDSGERLKIKVDKDLNASINTLVIDFDALLSIVDQGNNVYKLKPVLKLK
jgi:hypothetical protein